MRRSGPIDWCGVCGCFAETRAGGLTGECKGLPSQQLGIGRSSLNRLNSLRAGLHPVTFAQLPEATKLNGEALQGDGVYTRLVQTGAGSEPENFTRYTPELFPAPRPQLNGKTAAEKKRHMLGRIRFKEASEIRRLRKVRKLEAIFDARILYDNFLGGDEEEVEQASLCRVCDVEGGSDEEFWNGLSPIEPPSSVKPRECFRGMARPSRMQRLIASRSGKNELLQS